MRSIIQLGDEFLEFPYRLGSHIHHAPLPASDVFDSMLPHVFESGSILILKSPLTRDFPQDIPPFFGGVFLSPLCASATQFGTFISYRQRVLVLIEPSLVKFAIFGLVMGLAESTFDPYNSPASAAVHRSPKGCLARALPLGKPIHANPGGTQVLDDPQNPPLRVPDVPLPLSESENVHMAQSLHRTDLARDLVFEDTQREGYLDPHGKATCSVVLRLSGRVPNPGRPKGGRRGVEVIPTLPRFPQPPLSASDNTGAASSWGLFS